VVDSQTSVVFKQDIYLFGGFIGGHSPHYSQDLLKFDLSAVAYRLVQTAGSLPPPRSDHTAQMLGSLMLVFGGISGENQHLNDLFVLDMHKLLWTCVRTQGERPSERIGHAAVVCGEDLLILGGHEEASKEDTKLFAFNWNKKLWRKFGDRPLDEDFNAQFRTDSSMKKTLTDSRVSGSRSPGRRGKSSRKPLSPMKSLVLASSSQDKEPTPGKQPQPATLSTLKHSKFDTGPDSASKKITADSLKLERLKKKKELEKRRLLGEFQDCKVDEAELLDRDILKMQTVLSSITSDKAAKSLAQSALQRQKLRTMRPGVSLFAEKIASKLEPVRLPHLDSLSMNAVGSRVYIFGGDRCGLCSNDLFVFDSQELLQPTQVDSPGLPPAKNPNHPYNN